MSDSAHSLISGYIFDGQGGAKKIDWKEVTEWRPEQGVLWVHLNLHSTQTQEWVTTQAGLDNITASALLSEEIRPRSVFMSDGLLVFLRGVNLNPRQDPEDMVAIRLWLSQNRIITVQKRTLISVDDICDAFAKNNGPKSASDFLVSLNDKINNRIADVVEEIEEKVDELEEEVLTAQSHQLRPKIADLRRQTVMIRRYLAPQREALYRLYNQPSSFFDDTHKLLLRESTDRVIRYIEDLDSFRERAAISQEELSSRLSEQMEQRMYMLSMVAVIFLPLSFLTGLLGINVGGIPGSEHPQGFLIACSIMGAVGLSTILYFKRSRWL